MGVETDTRQFKFGDGATAWSGLPYVGTLAPDIGAVLAAGNDAGGLDLVNVDRLEVATVVPAALEDPTTATGSSGDVPTADGAGSWAWGPVVGTVSAPVELDEIATPGSPPASAKAFIYPKADGRIYSMDDAGTEYGPFDSGGADLSAFRLASVADDPGTLALGAYGDEMEYADDTDLATIWTPRGGTPPSVRACGSSISMLQLAHTGGHFRDASGFASAFEVGVLVSNNTGGTNSIMGGLAFVNSSGVGIAMSPYSDGNSYLWEIGGASGYGYQGTGPSGGATYSAWLDGRPVWFYVRYDGAGHWRLRWSETGASPTTLVAAASRAAVSGLSQYGWNHANNPGGVAGTNEMVHRYVYGAPDLGL
jgi:hypothetical protein